MANVAALKKVKQGNQAGHDGAGKSARAQNQNTEIQVLNNRLNEVTEQLKLAEARLGELEEREMALMEKEQEIDNRLLDLAGLKQEQEAVYAKRLAELEDRERELNEEHLLKMAEVEEMRRRYMEEHQARVAGFESELLERSKEIQRYIDVEYHEREKSLAQREARVEIRESVISEKEKFWAVMYDSVVKFTRVASSCK
ncbi:MAG: hypothetical protein K6U74_00585 [Firmicutes bacterium]|nr:hypothetical protein [Bacillota bacterium]